MRTIEVNDPKPSEIGVTASVWSLAVLCGATIDQASVIAEKFHAVTALIDRSQDEALEQRLLLALWFQQERTRPAIGRVLTLEATRAHHVIASAIEPITPGLGVGKLAWPARFHLPCRNCGYVFESRVYGGCLVRTCGECFAYEARPITHARGGLTQMTRGRYTYRRPGQAAGVTEFGTSVVCAHPDCLTLFFATQSIDEYCEEHRAMHRETLRRLRAKGPPKLERRRFFLAPGVNGLQYCHGALAEQTEIPPDGRCARDEEELQTLVQLAESGSLVVQSSS